MEPSLDTWTSLFLIAVVQGVFLSIMIFIRKSKANNLLGTLVLAFSICILFYVSYWTNYQLQINWRWSVFLGLTYTYGPLMYFYIRSSKKEFYFNPWHFVPFVLFIIHFLNWPNYPESWRAEVRSIQQIIQCAHLLIYSILILRFVHQNKGYTNGELKLYNWRKRVTAAFLAYSISFLVYFILVWTNLLLLQYDYMVSLSSVFFIYFIGYHGFQKPEVFQLYEGGKYEKSGLQSSASESILRSIKNKIAGDKIYLDSSIRLPNLADQLSISQHHISQVINELEGKNFADFINEYRVEEAKKLLLEGDRKLINVAYSAGFNNKNSFNNAFKKVTGLTPSEYKQHNLVSS